jgi:hypothetical protein
LVRQDCRQFANGPVKWRWGIATVAHTADDVSKFTEREVSVPFGLTQIQSSVSGTEENIRLLNLTKEKKSMQSQLARASGRILCLVPLRL